MISGVYPRNTKLKIIKINIIHAINKGKDMIISIDEEKTSHKI